MRRRRTAVRGLAGIVLLVLACGAALLSRGVAEATQELRSNRAHWQRGVVARPPETPGRMQKVAEHLLGVRTQSEVMRAYLDYRARLEAVIQGTVYPQTQARWNAIATISGLRRSLTRPRDRAAADVTLGVVYAASAFASGPGAQRQALRRNAVGAFRRAVLADPTNVEAKLDLEVLLAESAAASAAARSTSAGRENQQGTPTRTPRAQPVGTGY